MSLAFGVFDHLDASGAPLRDFYEDRLKLVELYDRLGFYCYHVAEHHSTPLGMAPSPSVFLSAVAQRTKRLNFGPLVYTLPLYHPIRLIEEICMLDQMSGGRFQFGTGKGISPIETRYYGVDPDNSREDDDRGVRGADARAAEPDARFRGRVLQFKNVPMEVEPLQKPHPPLWYGAGTPQSVERPARDRHEHRHQRAGRDRAHADRALLEALQRQRGEPPEDRLHPPSRRRRHRRGGAGDRAARLPPLAGELHEALARSRHQAGRRDVSGRVRRRRHERPRHRGLAADACCANCRRRSTNRARTTCSAAWPSAT